MPTPTGRPMAGEMIVDHTGELIGTVLERTRGDQFSVRLRNKNGGEYWVTNFPWWFKFKKWSIK